MSAGPKAGFPNAAKERMIITQLCGDAAAQIRKFFRDHPEERPSDWTVSATMMRDKRKREFT